MKKLIKYSRNISFVILAACILGVIAWSATGTLVGTGRTIKLVKTYANSQVDSLYYTTKGSESAISFAVHFVDSAKVTTILLYRQYDGMTYLPLVASTDSVLGGAGLTSVTNDTTYIKALTIAPFPEKFLIKVTYAGSGQGVTTPTVSYAVLRTEGK